MRFFLLLFLFISLSFTQDRAVTVTGTCLLEGETDHSVVWDASAYSSGVYFVRLVAGGFISN